MGPDQTRSRFERHPWITLLGVCAAGLIGLGIALELGLRATLDYHIDYYAGVTRPGRVEYPYGAILINSHGEPDVEWDLADPRPRLAFYGDSVTYGVGAGHGHRISDRIRAAHPDRQVLTFAAVGARLKDPERVAALAREFGIDVLVYLMNLNDLTPDRVRGSAPAPAREPGAAPPTPDHAVASAGTATRAAGSPSDEAARAAEPTPAEGPRAAGPTSDPGTRRIRALRRFVLDHLDFLRNKSYLYNFVRLRVKNLLVLHGFEASGFRAAELEPGRHPAVLAATAGRVNAAARRLREEGVRFCVVLLPYEMQISEEAAERYRELGVEWEEGFLHGSPQRALRRLLAPGLEVADARAAFLGPDPAASRAANPLGRFFVYDRGDKIDWNHPTRAGHRRVAEWLLDTGFCGL